MANRLLVLMTLAVILTGFTACDDTIGFDGLWEVQSMIIWDETLGDAGEYKDLMAGSIPAGVSMYQLMEDGYMNDYCVLTLDIGEIAAGAYLGPNEQSTYTAEKGVIAWTVATTDGFDTLTGTYTINGKIMTWIFQIPDGNDELHPYTITYKSASKKLIADGTEELPEF